MENKIGRLLRSDEFVHHANHDRSDDRIENLELTTLVEHAKHHNPPERMAELRAIQLQKRSANGRK